jgi:hypothetical protein
MSKRLLVRKTPQRRKRLDKNAVKVKDQNYEQPLKEGHTESEDKTLW